MHAQMDLELTSAPAALLALADAKAHLRVEHTDEDTLLTTLIEVATAHIEGRTGYLRRALVTQTWKLRLPEFPACDTIELPFPPLQSVSSVQYYDTNNTLQTMSSSDYTVNGRTLIGYVKALPTVSWPATYERDDAAIITYVAGYGAASAVPAPIKHAAYLILSDLYANRGDDAAQLVIAGATSVMTTSTRAAVERLLRPYRVHGWP